MGKYVVTYETLSRQDYKVEAESEEEAKEKVLSGESLSYGNAMVVDTAVTEATQLEEK